MRKIAILIAVGFLAQGCEFMKGFVGESSKQVTPSGSAENSKVLPSGMSRQSGVETVNKLIQLFPGATVEGSTSTLSDSGVQVAMRSAAATDQINPEQYFAAFRGVILKTVNGNSFNALVSLSGIDRSTGPLALLQARPLFESLCAQAEANESKTVLFNASSPSSILLPGESLPSDPSTQIAFIVARRAWNFPYVATSPEVQILKRVYDQSDSEKKKQVCLTALLSDQFWQGNPGPMDIPNRVLLTLTGKRPTLQQLDSFSRDKEAFHNFIRSAQSSQDYLDSVVRWHGSKLGLRTIVPDPLNQGIVSGTSDVSELSNITWHYTAANFGTANGSGYAKIAESYMSGIDGCSAPAKVDQDWTASVTAKARGSAPNLNQPFDPRTTGIFWEQYDTSVSRFKVVAGWVLKPFITQFKTAIGQSGTADAAFISANCEENPDDKRWLKCKGENFNGVRYGLDQIRNTNAVVGSGDTTACPDCKIFPSASLPAPTMDTAIVNGNGRVLRKAVRYTPSGRADGYSEIRSYWTNKPLKVCNSLARFLATCAYKPTNGAFNHQNNYEMDNGRTKGFVPQKMWTAAGFDVAYKHDADGVLTTTMILNRGPFRRARIESLYGTPVLETYAHPSILGSFRCGEPDFNVLASTTAPDTKAEFPGYDYLPDYKAGDESTETWLPASWKTSLAAVDQTHVNRRMNRNLYAGDQYITPDHPNEYLWSSIHDELNREPYRLIQAVISNRNPVDNSAFAGSGPDYSLLVRSNTTFVPKFVELLYRSRGEIPYHPKNYQITDAQSYTDLTQMQFSGAFSVLPARAINPSSSAGMIAYERPTAGIFQMPATLASMAPGSPRSIASRVFARYLCGEANMYDPTTEGGASLHSAAFNRLNQIADASNPYGTIFNDGNAKNYQGTMTNFMNTHVNRPDCMSCHTNLDPLGMALFKYYGTNLAGGQKLGQTMTGGEMKVPDNLNVLPIGISSVSTDAALGNGVFLGQEVRGFAGVTSKIASSRQFYSCAAETAFQNMFGRLPSSIEARKAYKNVVDDFAEKRDYNEMIMGLIKIQENLGGE